MARDTFKALGDGRTGRRGDSRTRERRSRLAPRVRALCILLCCALALQPSLLVPSRAASEHSAAVTRGSLASFTAHSLLTILSSIGAVVRPAAPAVGGSSSIPAAHLSAYEPEPAVAAFFLSAPAGLSVESTSDSQLVITWGQVPGAASYRVERSPNLLTPYSVVGLSSGNTFPDAGLSRGSTYLYRVRAIDSTGAVSPPSAVLMATAITFVDPELVGANDQYGRPATKVKADHVNDLRAAVAGVRRAALLPAVTWAETVASGVPVRADHVRELREKLDEALSALGLSHPAYTDTTLYTGQNGSTPTPIRKKHFEELRAFSTSGAGVTGSGLSAYDFASARLDASNRTGGGGVDLVSRNFNWSLPLVSLPGRAGLDLGLSLSYNSLVWTKSGSYMLFDSDGGWPAPGFRLGFPVVQGKFYDSQAQKYAYMLVTPSGARMSLRQTTTAGIYEAGDSSYLQLTEETNGALTIRATDGTRMSYWPLGGVYKCTEIKDRNGNFITVSYNSFDNIQTVTDTLGRAINFSYYGDGYLDEITQVWHREVEGSAQPITETHRWAKFYYADKVVRTNFTGLTVFGPANGQTVHALTKVKLSDDSSFTFNYTTWGQVNQIAGYAADNRLLNYVSLDLPADETTAQNDCPRPTERRDWAAYWNGDEDGAGASSEEAVTSYGTYNFAGGVAKATAPDGTVHQETYETSGWKKGLTTRADEFSADDHQNAKKTTTVEWHQDDDALTYAQNPRVTRTDISDSDGNHRRTDVSYIFWGLPEDVKEYDSNGTTVLRRTHTEYKATSVDGDGAYTLRRIIGLPAKQQVYGLDGGQEKLFSQVTSEYDCANVGETHYLEDAGTVAQHDGAYSAAFTTRGNLCRQRRWDVEHPADQSLSVATEAGYNTLGSTLFTSDALGHKTKISYTDSDNGARLAYPTKVTDPDNLYSTVEYNYDTGAVTRAIDSKGAAAKTFYDSVGRRLKVKSEVNGAYTKWEYGASGLYAKQFTTIDTGLAETFVMSVTDGAGRVRGTLREQPSSMSGGYSAQRFDYDNVGQRVKQYNPTEVTVNTSDPSDIGSWQPAGADLPANGGAGWAFASVEYDWKGRVKRAVAADGVTDRLADYDGCGCAGGAVVTIQGEPVSIPSGGTGRRAQKVYSDPLGRAWMTEVYNWDGTVYTTTTVKLDALDRAVRVRQYSGAAPSQEPSTESSAYQTTTLTYDGHGRLKSRHTPGQNAGAATAYEYFGDDTLKTVTDARGVKTSFLYNARHLVTNVTYDHQNVASVVTDKTGTPPVGTTPVADTPAVHISYDAAGNRDTMTDGSGSTTYHFNTLSQLTSEDKQFTGPATTYTLAYEYTLAGSLKKVTDQTTGANFSYDFDKAGQLTAVNSSGLGATTPLASGMEYRATGALKGMSYGNGTSVSLSYDSRGLVTHYGVGGVTRDGQYGALQHGSDFDYYADGQVKYASDLFTDSLTAGAYRLHDRAYSYDHAGRLQEAYSGAQANQFKTGTASGVDGAFRQSYTYDAFSNTTARTGLLWGADDNSSEPFASTGRNTSWEYDPDGRFISRNEDAPYSMLYVPLRSFYDAAGRLVQTTQTTSRPSPNPNSTQPITTAKVKTETYDGDGQSVKETGTIAGTTYYLRSSLLGGQAVSEYDGAGVRRVTHVTAGSVPVADSWNNGGTATVNWRHANPVTGDEMDTDSAGAVVSKATIDPMGVNLGDSDPSASAASDGEGGGTGQSQMNSRYAQLLPASLGGSGRCRLNGLFEVGCGMVSNMLMTGMAAYGSQPTVATIFRTKRYLDSPLQQPGGSPMPGGDMALALTSGGSGDGDEMPKLPEEKVTVLGRLDESILPLEESFLTNELLLLLTQTSSPQKPPKIDKTISNAAALARGIITGNNPCAAWFNPNGLQVSPALNALNDLEKTLTRGTIDGPSNTSTGIKMSGATTPVGNPVQYRVFQNAVVNNSGPFFNILSKTKIGKIYDPGRHQSQVLQILHELAHMVFKNGSPLIPGDVDPNNSSDKSEENTEEVLKHCKAEVDAIKN
jgi:YD repeat-containing protein